MSDNPQNDPPRHYRNPAYMAADAAAIVRAYPFATLVSGNLDASFAPIVSERDGDTQTLVGHLARRGPHAAAMRTGDPVLAIFSGPHAYISPRWYEEKPEVPTWDFIAAHVRGRLEMLDENEAQEMVLRRTIEFVESGFDRPWSIDDAEEGRVKMLLPFIRSFRIHVDTIEGTTKLSQTHPESDRARVVAGLRAQPVRTIADHIEALSAP